MATENEIVEKIKQYKDSKSPDFRKYMDFYKNKFPDFYNSKLKILEENTITSQENNTQEHKEEKPITENKLNNSQEEKKPINSQSDEDMKIDPNASVFNITKGKTTKGDMSIFEQSIEKKTQTLSKKPKSKKFLLIIIAILILGGLGVGLYLIFL